MGCTVRSQLHLFLSQPMREKCAHTTTKTKTDTFDQRKPHYSPSLQSLMASRFFPHSFKLSSNSAPEEAIHIESHK